MPMRTLLRFIQKYSDLLLFLFLEIIAIALIVQSSHYQRSKLIGLNRQVTGFIYSRVDGAREYFSLKEVNQQLADENMELRNKLDLITSSLDTATVITELRGAKVFLRTLKGGAQKHLQTVQLPYTG